MGYTHAIPIEVAPAGWVARRRQVARIVSAVLVAALCIDYGGGIGLKYLGIFLALAWIMTRRSTVDIWRRHWKDFVVLLILPTGLALVHLARALMFDPGFDTRNFIVRYYNTLSTPALLFLIPLIYFAGSNAVARQISIGFRYVSIVLIALLALHVSGIININDYWDFAQRYELGRLGLDPRLQGHDVSQSGQYSLRIGFSMPLVFGYELATSAMGAALMFMGFLVIGSRGLVLGAIVIAALWFLRGHTKRGVMWRLLLALGLAIALLVFSAPLRFRLTEVFVHRSAGILAGSDYTTLIRLGHIKGYADMIAADPWKIFVGAGPTGYIINPVWKAILGYGEVAITELSILNVAIYYGVPYAILFAYWLFRSASRLWKLRHHPDFEPADAGLIIGATIFWITGNINPQMLAPFSMIAFMLLTVRRDELLTRESADSVE
jgi:hypothetical protein